MEEIKEKLKKAERFLTGPIAISEHEEASFATYLNPIRSSVLILLDAVKLIAEQQARIEAWQKYAEAWMKESDKQFERINAKQEKLSADVTRIVNLGAQLETKIEGVEARLVQVNARLMRVETGEGDQDLTEEQWAAVQMKGRSDGS